MTEEDVRRIVREEIKTALCRDCAPNGTAFLTAALDKAFEEADAQRTQEG